MIMRTLNFYIKSWISFRYNTLKDSVRSSHKDLPVFDMQIKLE